MKILGVELSNPSWPEVCIALLALMMQLAVVMMLLWIGLIDGDQLQPIGIGVLAGVTSNALGVDLAKGWTHWIVLGVVLIFTVTVCALLSTLF